MKLKTMLIWIVVILSIILGVGGYFYYSSEEYQQELKEKRKNNKEYHDNHGSRFRESVGPFEAAIEKPAIYLYPEKEQQVSVKLTYNGDIFAHYPDYDIEKQGWEVIAQPDGTLMNLADHKGYSYLFWEGRPAHEIDYNMSQGFVVKGSDTKAFLQEKLAEMGLKPKEYNEFIVYWFPKMQNNPYNLIHFSGKAYTDSAPLSTNPPADSMLRVFMVFKRLETPVEVEAQTFPPFERKGFTVVEWGGTEIQ